MTLGTGVLCTPVPEAAVVPSPHVVTAFGRGRVVRRHRRTGGHRVVHRHRRTGGDRVVRWHRRTGGDPGPRQSRS